MSAASSRPSLSTRRVLVTGATGFLGAALCRRLLGDGAEVHALVRCTSDRSRLAGLGLTVREGCLTEPASVEAAVRESAPELVFHCAAAGGHSGARDPDAVFRHNVLATHILLQAVQRHGARLVHVCTSTAFAPSAGPIAEDHPLLPRTAFGAAKVAATLMVRQRAQDGVSVRVVRPFAIFGPGESERRLVPRALRAALTGERLPLTPAGYVRDFIYVDDVCDALVRAAVLPDLDGELFHVGTGVETSNEDLVAAVEAATGRKVTVDVGAWPPHPTDRRSWCADASHARRRLGWSPTTTLAEGLRRTLATWGDHA